MRKGFSVDEKGILSLYNREIVVYNMYRAFCAMKHLATFR